MSVLIIMGIDSAEPIVDCGSPRESQNTRPLIIMGVDPSLSGTGIALIKHDTELNTREVILTHTINTKKLSTTPTEPYRRCYEIYKRLSEFYLEYNPDILAIEMSPGSATNAQTSKCFGMCIGLLSMFYNKIDYFYNCMAIKRFVDGDLRRRTSKDGSPGNKEIKGSDRKLLNIQKCNELYPNNDLRKNKLGNVILTENNAADALLLAHMASIDFPLTSATALAHANASKPERNYSK